MNLKIKSTLLFYVQRSDQFMKQYNLCNREHIIIMYKEQMKAEMKGQSAIEHTLLLNSMKFTTWTIILVNPFPQIFSGIKKDSSYTALLYHFYKSVFNEKSISTTTYPLMFLFIKIVFRYQNNHMSSRLETPTLDVRLPFYLEKN